MLIFVLKFSGFSEAKNSEILIITAINELIDEFYIKHNISYEIINYGDEVYQNNLVNNLIKSNKEYSKFKLKHIKNTTAWNHRLTQSAIIFINDTEQQLFFLSQSILDNDFHVNFRFIFILKNGENLKKLVKFNFTNIMNVTDGHMVQFSYFVTKSAEKIELYTVDWFQENLCSLPSMILYNVFNTTAKTWRNKLSANKFKNFNKCMIVIPARINSIYCNVNKVVGLQGVLPEIARIAAKKVNFVFNYQLIVIKNNSLHVVNNSILTPHIEKYSVISITRKKAVHTTTSISEMPFVFLTPLGEKYTNWEKVLLPFDCFTWTLLIITFGVAFLAVFTINKIRFIFLRNLIYGINVQHPAFNILGSFFGISQPRLPRENFARIILIFFLFFCLIIRTAYQGVLFEMMTSDMRKKLPERIDELYSKGYKISTEIRLLPSLNDMIAENKR